MAYEYLYTTENSAVLVSEGFEPSKEVRATLILAQHFSLATLLQLRERADNRGGHSHFGIHSPHGRGGPYLRRRICLHREQYVKWGLGQSSTHRYTLANAAR